MRFCSVFLALALTAALGCGRGLPFEETCPQGSRLEQGRCVVPPASGGPVDAGFVGSDGGTSTDSAVVNTTRLDFGRHLLGSRSRQTLVVSNPGFEPVLITVFDVSDRAFRLDGPIGEPIVIAPQSEIQLAVDFVPGAPGEFVGNLGLELCAAGCPLMVGLVGRGVFDPLACESPLNFGAVPLQSCQQAPMRCTSVVDDPTTVETIRIDPFGPEFRSTTLPPIDVGPGSQVEFPVEFCPVFDGPVQANLRLTASSNEISRTFVAGIMAGQGRSNAECVLEVVPEIDFGGVPPRTRTRTNATVVNRGRLPCGFTVLGIDGGQGAFSVVNPPEGRPVQIGVGQQIDLVVDFEPNDFVLYEARLLFQTNDPRNPRGEILLRGAGLTDRTFTVTSRLSGPFSPLQGGPVQWTGNADDGFAEITLPFTFNFLGNSSRFVRVSSNGFITFASQRAAELRNQALPSSVLPNALVALWWDDLHPGRADAPGLVTTRTSNLNGQTIFHIAYISVAAISGSTDRITGEIRLFANSNVIELHYGAYTNAPGLSQFSASAGWEGPSGVLGADILGCGASCRQANFPANTVFTLTPSGP